MDDLAISAESRWRLNQQTLGVAELAGDLRPALSADDGRPADWPADLTAHAAGLGDDLRVQAEFLAEATRAATSVDDGHRALVASSEVAQNDLDHARLVLGASRDEVLRLAVVTDFARARTDVLVACLDDVEVLLDFPSPANDPNPADDKDSVPLDATTNGPDASPG